MQIKKVYEASFPGYVQKRWQYIYEAVYLQAGALTDHRKSHKTDTDISGWSSGI